MYVILTYTKEVYNLQLIELISLPIYTDAKVIAGHSGMNKIVQSLTIMDAPDIIHFLKPQELLLTTGYAMKDHPDQLLTLVTNMSAVGCAGLAIKTRRFMSELPEEVLRTADELQFPIIELSLEHSLGDISNQSLSYILEKRTDELNYALATHKQFSKMIMQGKGTLDIIEALSQLTKSPVMLINASYEQQHTSQQLSQVESNTWLSAIKTYLELEVIDSAVELNVRTNEKIDDVNLLVLELLPIFTFQLEGYLITSLQHDGVQFRTLIKHAMEQAANVIGLELMKKQAVKERSRRYKNEFFSDFVDGMITSEQELLHRGKYYDLLNLPFYMSGVAKSDTLYDRGSTTSNLETDGLLISERDRQYNTLKTEFAKLELRYVIFTKNDYFGFIIAPEAQGDIFEGKERKWSDSLQHIVDNMNILHGIPISIGVGNPVAELTDVPLSYREAVEALQTGYAEHKKHFLQHYQAKNLMYLLRMLPREEMKEYYEETFRELLHIENQERTELMKTLRIFYDTHCGLAPTAQQLFVHRNTVTYRLEKCEKLTGRTLRDSMESLRFRIAFAMESLLSD